MVNTEIQTQILDAAETRFEQYGYNKTTMAEVAGDCLMSAANLYRYFGCKLDIGAALARRCLAEKEALLLDIVNTPNLPAADKLLEFTLQELRHTYEQLESTPKLSELIEAMVTQRPDVADQHWDNRLILLIQLLNEGKASGEFYFENVEEVADSIHAATFLFHFPLNMSMHDLSDLEHKAKNVISLLLKGLLTKDNR